MSINMRFIGTAGMLAAGLCSGCQSLPSWRSAKTTASVPPLSSPVGGKGHLTPGILRDRAPVTTLDLIPPEPEPIVQAAWTPPPVPSAAVHPVPPALIPVTPQPVPPVANHPPHPPAPLPASVPVATAAPPPPAARTVDDCLPDWNTWKAEFRRETELLSKKISELEQELHQTRGELTAVNSQLQASQSEILRLNTEVARGQQQVRSLESRLQAQQQADLDALNELHETLNHLLGQPQAGRAEVRK